MRVASYWLAATVGAALVAAGVGGYWRLVANSRSGHAEHPPVRMSVEELAALKAKAGAGDRNAQSRLGRYFAEDLDGKPDYGEAAKWYLLAARQGDVDAQLAMGDLREAGQGVATDHFEALKWYRAAADQGSDKGAYDVGVMHQFGRGTSVNQIEAAKWYSVSANLGNPWAQFSLGQRCELGVGIPRDYAEAYKWFSLASAQRLSGAKEALGLLAAKMDPAQIAEGRHRAAEFAVKRPATK